MEHYGGVVVTPIDLLLRYKSHFSRFRVAVSTERRAPAPHVRVLPTIRNVGNVGIVRPANLAVLSTTIRIRHHAVYEHISISPYYA